MKKIVVSFADESGNYRKQMKRLEESLEKVGFDGIFKGYTSFEEIGSPPHKGPGSVPYAFKAYAIKKGMQELDSGLFLWLDSPIYATNSLNGIFEHIDDEGYIFFDNIGHNLGTWTSDACLERFNISRERSFGIHMTMACAYGFSTDSFLAMEMMQDYIGAAADGVSYRGDWYNNQFQVSRSDKVHGHRHDQAVQSALLWKYRMNLTIGQSTFFAYKEHIGRMPVSDSVCLWSEAMR